MTVIVKLCDGPVHVTEPLSKVGVTTIVATSGDVPVLMPLKLTILPDPMAARPIVVLSLTQLKVVVPPEFTVTKLTAATGSPLHTT